MDKIHNKDLCLNCGDYIEIYKEGICKECYDYEQLYPPEPIKSGNLNNITPLGFAG